MKRLSHTFHRLLLNRVLIAAIFFTALAARVEAAPAIRVNPLQRNAAGTAAPVALTDPRAAAIAEHLSATLANSPMRTKQTLARQAAAIGKLERDSGSTITVRLRAGVGTPSLMRGRAMQRAAGGGTAGDADELTARAFLRQRREILRLDDPDSELVLERADRDQLGRRHLRFAQRRHGIPVWPADLIVHLDAAGDVDAMNGAFVPTPRLAMAPIVSADAAIATARGAIPGGESQPVNGPALIVYAPGDPPARLAWKLAITTALAARWIVVVDARSGDVLASFNDIPSANVQGSGVDLLGDTRTVNVWSEGGFFYLVDTSKPSFDATSDPPDPATTRGGIAILDARNEPPNDHPQDIPELFYVAAQDPHQFDVPDGISAAAGLSAVYDYYLERHARRSLDGADGGILGIVRLGQNYFNAFWSGSYMAFGDADLFAGSLDVVAHELTHGVTQYTANLVYMNESGALNEAFSDIFGESVEAFVNGEPDWLIGSQIEQPVRDMSDPNRFGQPDSYDDFRVTSTDNGGVHINSGIINHAFYQLVEGLDGAIDQLDAERIFYRALAFHLAANSRFIDARLAAITAANELFGEDSEQARQTAAAFDEVEIFDDDPTPEPTPFPGVDSEDSTLFLRYDADFEDYFLARREEFLQDNPNGEYLPFDFAVAAARPSVFGDGSIAVFVDASNDACLISTDGITPIISGDPSPYVCLGFPGMVNSVAVDPDGDHFGFVLLDDSGVADNMISVIDLSAGAETITYELFAPALDGAALDTILFADAMDFTADGKFLIYDALNELELLDGSLVHTWSILALDLESGESQAIVPPALGFDIAYPFLGQRSDNFVVFDVFDASESRSTIMAADITSGEAGEIGTVEDGFGVPGYTGDDTAIVYSQSSDTATGFSLLRQAVAADRITPQGGATEWLDDADFSVIYRRGDFVGPGACAGDCNGDGAVNINELIQGVSIALNLLSPDACSAFDRDGDDEVSIAELIAAVNAALDDCA